MANKGSLASAALLPTGYSRLTIGGPGYLNTMSRTGHNAFLNGIATPRDLWPRVRRGWEPRGRPATRPDTEPASFY